MTERTEPQANAHDGATSHLSPSLSRVTVGDIAYWTDVELAAARNIVVAFSERSGGESVAPYASLNLGLHVGDDPAAVHRNRLALLAAAGVADSAPSLVSAHQVHGTALYVADPATAPLPHDPVPDTDALATSAPDVPLMLCFADCVPIVLVSPDNPRAVAVVHSGWRGTLDGIVGETLREMIALYGVDPAKVLAYIGPYIGPENFEVGEDVWALFAAKFGTLSAVKVAPQRYRFDLGDAVRESLHTLGVQSCHIVSLGACTVESVDHFFSFRAEDGVTGRLAALACIN